MKKLRLNPTKKYIVALNGKPESGKGTIVSIVYNNTNLHVWNTSIVNVIKAMASLVTEEDQKKDDKYRKFINDLLVIVTKYNDGAYNKVLDYISTFVNDEDANVLFIDIRDTKVIDRLKKQISLIYGDRVIFKSLFVIRPDTERPHGNPADDELNVKDYKYDYVINNIRDFKYFELMVLSFVEHLITGKVVQMDPIVGDEVYDQIMHNPDKYPKNYVYIINGINGPTGKTVLTQRLRLFDYIAIDISQCEKRKLNYPEEDYVIIVRHEINTVYIELNKEIPKERRAYNV